MSAPQPFTLSLEVAGRWPAGDPYTSVVLTKWARSHWLVLLELGGVHVIAGIFDQQLQATRAVDIHVAVLTARAERFGPWAGPLQS